MNMHPTFVRGYFLSFLILGILFVPSISFAQTGSAPSGAFVIKPAKVELVVAPGDKGESVLTLENDTSLPLHIDVSFEDVGPNVQTSPTDEPVKLLGTHGGEYALRDLLSTPTSSFDLLSGKEVRVPVTIRIPKDTEAGGRYGSVVFRFRPVTPSGAPQSANIAIESRVATLFFVRVSGEVKESGRLVAFDVFNKARSVPTPTAEEPLRFQVAYENTGNIHLDPYGRVTITSFFGKEKVIPIDPWIVLPGAVRMRELSVSDDLPIGHYRAHIELNRGYGDIIDEQEVAFWVLPRAEETLFFVVIVLALALIVRRSLRISKNRAF